MGSERERERERVCTCVRAHTSCTWVVRFARRIEETLVVWTEGAMNFQGAAVTSGGYYGCAFPSSQLSNLINFLSYFLKINDNFSESFFMLKKTENLLEYTWFLFGFFSKWSVSVWCILTIILTACLWSTRKTTKVIKYESNGLKYAHLCVNGYAVLHQCFYVYSSVSFM